MRARFLIWPTGIEDEPLLDLTEEVASALAAEQRLTTLWNANAAHSDRFTATLTDLDTGETLHQIGPFDDEEDDQ